MPRTIKFSISMPASEFKALEAGRRKAGRTRSQYVRDILAAESGAAGRRPKKAGERGAPGPWVGTVREEGGDYGSPLPDGLPDISELRRRAIAAAGRFESGLPDLSTGHDRHLADPPDEDGEHGSGTGGDDGERP